MQYHNQDTSYSYLATLLDPVNSEVVSIPDQEMKFHVTRSLDLSTTYLHPSNLDAPNPDVLLMWLPHSSDPCVRVYLSQQGLGQFTLYGKLFPAQQLCGNYEYMRPISGLISVRSATQTTTNVAIGGTINAVEISTPVDINSINYQSILSFSSSRNNKVAGHLIADGVVALAPPYAKEYMLPALQHSPTTTAFPPYSPYPTYNHISNKVVYLQLSSTFNPTPTFAPLPNSPFGRIRVKWIATVATFSAVTNAIVTMQPAISYNTTDVNGLITANTVQGYMNTYYVASPQANAMVFQGTETFYADHHIQQVGFFLNGGIPAGVTVALEIEYLDYWSPGFADTGSLIMLTGFENDQQILISGKFNYEAIPNQQLAQNIDNQTMGEIDPIEMQTAQVLFGASGYMYKTIWTMSQYTHMIKHDRDSMTDKHNAVGRASTIVPFLSSIFQNIPKISRGIRNFVDTTDDFINTGPQFLSKLGIAGTSSNYGSTGQGKGRIGRCSTKAYTLEDIMGAIMGIKNELKQTQEQVAFLSNRAPEAPIQVEAYPEEEEETSSSAQVVMPVINQPRPCCVPGQSVLMPNDNSIPLRLANACLRQASPDYVAPGDFPGVNSKYQGLAYFPVIIGSNQSEILSICKTSAPASVVSSVEGVQVFRSPVYHKHTNKKGDFHIDTLITQNDPLSNGIQTGLPPGFYTLGSHDVQISGYSYELALVMASMGVVNTEVCYTGTIQKGVVLTELAEKVEAVRSVKMRLFTNDRNGGGAIIGKGIVLPKEVLIVSAGTKDNGTDYVGWATQSLACAINKNISAAPPLSLELQKRSESGVAQRDSRVQTGTIYAKVNGAANGRSFEKNVPINVFKLAKADHRQLYKYYPWSSTKVRLMNDGAIYLGNPDNEAQLPDPRYYGGVMQSWVNYFSARNSGKTKAVIPVPPELNEYLQMTLWRDRWAKLVGTAQKYNYDFGKDDPEEIAKSKSRFEEYMQKLETYKPQPPQQQQAVKPRSFVKLVAPPKVKPKTVAVAKVQPKQTKKLTVQSEAYVPEAQEEEVNDSFFSSDHEWDAYE
jgi:hypothetical protein